MMKHVIVKNAGPLQSAVLMNLGRVNVVCGRNNSGKSTLLTGILDARTRSAGRRTAEIDLSAMTSSGLARTAWRGGAQHERENVRFAECLATTLGARDVWFAADAAEFASLFHQEYSARPLLKRWAFAENEMTIPFSEQVADKLKVVLIPPKRSIEIERGISLADTAHPSGAGILNNLFFGKSVSSDLPERQLHDKLQDALFQIADGYRFDVVPERNSNLKLKFAWKGQRWVDAPSCGLGLQDLLVMLYFAVGSDADVICIEEPESHLHPDMQRRLMFYLREKTVKQYVLSTHSNVFLDNAAVDRVFFTTYDGNRVSVDDATSRATMLGDLGYSVTDNLVSDVVILVEGPSDVGVIEELLRKRGLLQRFNIRLWPLGGDIMDQLDLTIFQERSQLIALIDADPGSKEVRKRFVKKCGMSGIPVHKLKRRAIENYFSVAALRAVFADNVPGGLHAIDPDVRLDEQIGFNVKRSNRQIAAAMTEDDIAGTDLERFVQRISEMCGA